MILWTELMNVAFNKEKKQIFILNAAVDADAGRRWTNYINFVFIASQRQACFLQQQQQKN